MGEARKKRAAKAAAANLLKGQVAFTAGADSYVLTLDFNVLCVLEQRLKMAAGDFGALMQGPMAIRATFHVGLLEAHPEITERDVGRIITEIGFAEAERLIETALIWALPEPPKPGEEAAGEAGPQTPAAGT